MKDGSAPALHIARPPFLSDPALLAVLAALPEARLVGGCVRDALAGRDVADVDLATPQAPEAVAAALAAAGLRAVPTGLQHGTITAVSGGRGFEVTTLRRDERTDGRHAEVAWTADWREDAARRDFTMNAMSMQPDGAVFDYFGGAADLVAGHVRFVGDPAARIAEDYLRILRFFRFQARYGRGDPDAAALAALQAGVPGMAQLSTERVWSELKRILATPAPIASLRLMERLGVLAAILPGAVELDRLERLVAIGGPEEPVLRFAALTLPKAFSRRAGEGWVRVGPAEPATVPVNPPPPGPSPVLWEGQQVLADRFRMSSAERDRLAALDGLAPTSDMDDDALRRLLADSPVGAALGWAWLAGFDLRERLAIPRPVFPLVGRDALAAGVLAGPAVGVLLRDVRGWWLEGGCRAGAAACRAELARRVAA